jgi:hypothetical protein
LIDWSIEDIISASTDLRVIQINIHFVVVVGLKATSNFSPYCFYIGNLQNDL